jgi:hypothetical protein
MPRPSPETPIVASCVEPLTSWAPCAALIGPGLSTDPVTCPA